MNVAALTQYVALFCLLAFTAFSNALHAQSTEVQTEGDGKKTTSVRKMVIRTNTNTAVGQNSKDNVTALVAPMLFTASSSQSRSCCKSNPSNATGTASEVNVVAVKADDQNGGKPKRIVVKRTVENGKETVTVNGTKVEGNTSITDLPEDVQALIGDMPAMFETSVENMGDDKIQIYRYGHGEGKANGGAQVFTFENDGEDGGVIEKQVWINAPNCAVFGADSSQVYKFNFKFDAEGMKQRCEEMSKRFSEMGFDTNMAGRCQVRIMKNFDQFGAFADTFMVAVPHAPVVPVPPMFVMDMDMEKYMDIMVEVPDAPSVRSFETDDLGDVPELYRTPEADVNSEAPTTQPAPEVHKRYKVIIIERSDDDKEVTKELEVSSPALEAEENTRQNTLPSNVTENNAIKAEYFNVYPNPTPGTLNISFALTQPGAVTVTVTDLLGNKVFGETVENLNGQYYKQLDMEQHARGTYLVRVEQNGQAISRTIAVQ